jgi:hypothetical protein
MKIELSQINGFEIAGIISNELLISEVQDALDIIRECGYYVSGKIILREKKLK